MTEQRTIVSPLLKALKLIPGVVAYRIHASLPLKRMRGAGKGLPDIAVVLRGVPLFFEAKRPKGSRYEDGQLEKHEELRRCGARVEVVRSVAEAIAVVREILASASPRALVSNEVVGDGGVGAPPSPVSQPSRPVQDRKGVSRAGE